MSHTHDRIQAQCTYYSLAGIEHIAKAYTGYHTWGNIVGLQQPWKLKISTIGNNVAPPHQLLQTTLLPHVR